MDACSSDGTKSQRRRERGHSNLGGGGVARSSHPVCSCGSTGSTFAPVQLSHVTSVRACSLAVSGYTVGLFEMPHCGHRVVV